MVRRMLAVGALVAMVVAAVASTDSGSESSSGGSGGGGGGASASAELACTHFRNVAGDIAAGILTDAEIRTKLQEVHNNAKVADEADIAGAAQRMLAAATALDVGALGVAAGDMDSACSTAGL